MGVTITYCTSSTELFHQFKGEHERQSAYIELDLRNETLLASYDGVVGSGSPFSVAHGFERRYVVPLLTGEAANRLMDEIAPLASRVVADWEEHWDGSNFVAVLGEDATAAEAEMEELLSAETDGGSTDSLVAEWDLDGAVNGNEVAEFGITADTTDARLDEVEAEILAGLARCSEASVAVCDGLSGHLRGLRDELRQDQDD
ncbi:hypothetical protein C0Q58_14470 [Streptomyces albidoflavus]|uniref:hypothetical protein n=1 Tax=Streptomyces albidoflavus TaxID=1886 RepID=UPI00101E58BF|nr:hypothetical protein [Streptomyces albidoflavus]RZD62941.1 hypothetical protein C0Q58_14470 [Streptomyces albidoflavus]